MKILLLCPSKDYRDHPKCKGMPWLRMSIPFREGIYEPLKRLFGHGLQTWDYVDWLLERNLSFLQSLHTAVEIANPDYVLWVAFRESSDIPGSTFDWMRSRGIKVIAWFFDDNLRFETYSRQWLTQVDYVLTDTPDCVAKYEALGKPAAFALPIPDIRIPVLPMLYDVSFVGDLRANRTQYLAALKAEKINVLLAGEAGHNFLSYEDMLRVFAQSRINLNFARTYDGSMLGLKARVFEVCMAGGFLLTEFAPGLADFFLPGQEISIFSDAADLVGKIKYYLKDTDERQAMAAAGAARARQYTATEFLRKAFEKFERNGHGN